MSRYGKHPRLTRTTEPVDATIWHWFICNGPHGERFCWHREVAVARLRDIELLAQFMLEKEGANPGFLNKARAIAIEALENDDPVIALTAVQVLAVVGDEEDMRRIQPLLKHSDDRVVSNARCALFERKVKARKNES